MKLKAVTFQPLVGSAMARVARVYETLGRLYSLVRTAMNVNHERSSTRTRTWFGY